MNDAWIAIFGAVFGGLVTAFTSFSKNKTDFQKALMEDRAGNEKLYDERIDRLLETYTKEFDRQNGKLEKMEEEMRELKAEINTIKEKHEKEVSFLEENIEQLEEELESVANERDYYKEKFGNVLAELDRLKKTKEITPKGGGSFEHQLESPV